MLGSVLPLEVERVCQEMAGEPEHVEEERRGRVGRGKEISYRNRAWDFTQDVGAETRREVAMRAEK